MASRRAALVLPVLLALVVGLLVAFWPRVRESLRPRPQPVQPSVAPEAAPESVDVPFSPIKEGSPAPAAAGSLRVTVRLDGLPLKGAEVSVQREGTTQVRTFVTGDSGSRDVQGMPPGGYSVSAVHAEYLPAHGRIDLSPGQRAELPLEVRRGGRVSGRVTDDKGEPLPGTDVYLVDAKSKVTMGEAQKARTGADGRYVMPPIHPGEYGIRFRHPKHRIADRYGVNIISGTEVYEIDIALEAGCMIAGRVTSEQGLPLADAQIQAFTEGYGSIVVSDGDGRFAVHGLLEQTVAAVARRAGYGTVFVRNIRPNTTDLEIRMPRAGEIAGTIEADPLPEMFAVTLARYDEEIRRVIRVDTRMFSSTTTGNAFRVPDLTPAVYWVQVEAEGYEAIDQPQVAVIADQTATGLKVRLRRK